MPTRLEWAVAIQKGLGIDPYSEGNVTFVNLMVAEGSKAEDNPTDTIEPEPGATPFNTFDGGLHVENYPTLQEGVTATIATLDNGDNVEVLQALRNKEDAEQVTAAITNHSSWSGAGSLYLKTLPTTRADWATLSAFEVPGPTPAPVPVVVPEPVKPPEPENGQPSPSAVTNVPEAAAVESAVSAQEAEVKVDTAEGKASAAKAVLAKIKTHLAELEDLLK